jgi:hypothetical protein
MRRLYKNVRRYYWRTLLLLPWLLPLAREGAAAALLGDTLGNLTSPVDTRFLFEHHLHDVAWGNGRFVAVGSTGVDETEVFLSEEGETWERVSLGKPARPLSASGADVGALHGVAWNGLRFVAVGERIVTSPDGASWNVTAAFSSCVFSRVVAHYGMFVAVGGNPSGGCIATSPDGISWTERTAEIEHNTAVLTDVIRAESTFVAIGGAYQGRFGILSVLLFSSDGVHWTRHTGPADFLVDAAWNGALFVVVGGLTRQGVIFTSPDAKEWTENSGAVKNPLRAVVWSGSQFVAVGAEGEVVTSPNGVNWTERRTNVPQDLLGVVWNGSLFVTVGEGVILTSVDGVRWQEPGARGRAPIEKARRKGKHDI